MSDSPARRDFVKRLIEASDNSPFIPPLNAGRYAVVAKHLGVSEEAVRKWYSGMSFPNRDRVKQLAQHLGVDELWLAHGRKPEMDRKETAQFARNVEGAVLLVAGLVSLAGGTCAWPSPTDPKRGLVDFYAITGGRQHSVHVCLARPTGDGVVEIEVPAQIDELTAIGVVPTGRRGRYDFITLPEAEVKAQTNRRTGGYLITIENTDGVYTSGKTTWKPIRNFADL